MTGDDFELTAGWGHNGSGKAVMPGQGRVEQREYTECERGKLGAAKSVLGDSTFDIYLNDKAFWRNVPGRDLELQTRRLPGAQEVAVVPRT